MTIEHPGEMLRQELETRGLSANKLALALRVPSGRITQILNAQRSVTPDTALRLQRYFGTPAEEWMRLQAAYDLAVAARDTGEQIRAEVAPAEPNKRASREAARPADQATRPPRARTGQQREPGGDDAAAPATPPGQPSRPSFQVRRLRGRRRR